MKSNKYYYDIIQRETSRVFSNKRDRREGLNACNTLIHRFENYLRNDQINSDDFNTVYVYITKAKKYIQA